jgi:hypothetical protein
MYIAKSCDTRYGAGERIDSQSAAGVFCESWGQCRFPAVVKTPRVQILLLLVICGVRSHGRSN